MSRLPVGIQSLLVQGAALILALILHRLLSPVIPILAGLWQFALLQGVVAATLSAALRQPVWWLPLHAGFLSALVFAQQFNLSPWAYLLGFVLLVFVFWTTFRTRVPLFRSGPRAWQELAQRLPCDRPFRFIDLGSGLGDVPLHLEPRFPNGTFTGTEIAPGPWLVSLVRARLSRSRVRFLRRDYGALDLGEFDVVFAFLSPAAMPQLWQQVQGQMRAGTLFVSLSFTVEDRQWDEEIELAAGARHRLYVWRM